jgi:hypothetical protein
MGRKKTPPPPLLPIIIGGISNAFKTVSTTISTLAQQLIGLFTKWLATLPPPSIIAQSWRQNKLVIFIGKTLKYFQRHSLVIFVLFLLLAFATLTLAAIIPKTHNFEGELTVEELSFIYDGNKPQLLLDNILQLQSIEGEGKQTFTLSGKFQSSSIPKLEQIKKLKIELTGDKSKWEIKTVKSPSPSPSQIELTELRLEPQAKISKLRYDFVHNQLSFSLDSSQPNELPIYLGQKPLEVTLIDFRLPELNLQIPKEISFILTPDNPSFQLIIAEINNFWLTTPILKNTKYRSWFRGRLAVKNVEFSRVNKGENVSDDLRISTIIEGKVRMAEQEKSLQTNQFLYAEPPGVQSLYYINLAPSSDPKTSGIKVQLAGKTKSLQIGLDPKFPVTKIQASWLDGILPRDAIIALISFSAASFSYLLYWLVERVSKNNPNP